MIGLSLPGASCRAHRGAGLVPSLPVRGEILAVARLRGVPGRARRRVRGPHRLAVAPLDEYMRLRSPAPGRVKLLRSKADADCAVQAAAFFGPRGTVELAAIRLARAPPSAALFDRFAVQFSISGWPGRRNAARGCSRRPRNRTGRPPYGARVLGIGAGMARFRAGPRQLLRMVAPSGQGGR